MYTSNIRALLVCFFGTIKGRNGAKRTWSSNLIASFNNSRHNAQIALFFNETHTHNNEFTSTVVVVANVGIKTDCVLIFLALARNSFAMRCDAIKNLFIWNAHKITQANRFENVQMSHYFWYLPRYAFWWSFFFLSFFFGTQFNDIHNFYCYWFLFYLFQFSTQNTCVIW